MTCDFNRAVKKFLSGRLIMCSRQFWNSHQRHKFLRATETRDIVKIRVSEMAFPGVFKRYFPQEFPIPSVGEYGYFLELHNIFKIILVQSSCPLKIKITQFRNGFHLNVFGMEKLLMCSLIGHLCLSGPGNNSCTVTGL